MNSNRDLKVLFKFEWLIHDLQKKVTEKRIQGINEERIKPTIEIIDALLEIYNGYDHLYYGHHYSKEKISRLQHENIQLCKEIELLTSEKNKLLKSIEWDQHQTELKPTGTTSMRVELNASDVLTIEEKVHPDNRSKFITAVKHFIEMDSGRNNGNFYIEFNNDYTKIRKQNYI